MPGTPAPLGRLGAAATLPALALALACAGPGGTPATGAPAPASAPTELADQIGDLISGALHADARLERAESLYAPSALIIANGQRRTGVPRYAGIEPGGQIAVASSRVDITRVFTWGYLEYRWFSTEANRATEGRVTVLLAPSEDGGQWQIVHAHSSTMR